MVPTGWSDWEAARDVIVASLKAVGINAEAKIVDYNGLVTARNSGDFDLCLNNEIQICNTPWTYYDYMFRQPLMEGAAKNRNYGSYSNPDAWALVQQLDKTPVDDVAAMQKITSQLQKISLTDMPVIPLWYNGLWSQVSNVVWTGWPSDEGTQILPGHLERLLADGRGQDAHQDHSSPPSSRQPPTVRPSSRHGTRGDFYPVAIEDAEDPCDGTSGASSSSTCSPSGRQPRSTG